jgi:hypothetical protein
MLAANKRRLLGVISGLATSYPRTRDRREA